MISGEHDPQAWNGYAYVRNNPLRFTDPTGKRRNDIEDEAQENRQVQNWLKWVAGEWAAHAWAASVPEPAPPCYDCNALVVDDSGVAGLGVQPTERQSNNGGVVAGAGATGALVAITLANPVPGDEVVVVAAVGCVYYDCGGHIYEGASHVGSEAKGLYDWAKGKVTRKPGSQGTFKGADAHAQENKMVKDAAKEAGGLTKRQQRQLHDEITGEGLSYQEIVEIARDIKKGNK